jgi:hypothetical protein
MMRREGGHKVYKFRFFYVFLSAILGLKIITGVPENP